jgi:hypothetical protein
MERTDYIAEAITAQWGERCPDADPECFCCLAWAQYDRIADTEADLLRRHNDAVDRGLRIETLTRERDEVREALKRLGSSECMTLPFFMKDSLEGKELHARIDFARAALKSEEPTP